jgi:hypothetical protein
MFMRGFFPLLLCAALFPFSVQAEDAPLPFDVPAAAPAIQRTTVVSKPAAHPVATQVKTPQAKSQRPTRLKHATRAKKPSATNVAKKQKGKRSTAVAAKKTKGTHSPALVSKKTTKLSQKRSTAKPKATVHKKQSTKQSAHKKKTFAKKH